MYRFSFPLFITVFIVFQSCQSVDSSKERQISQDSLQIIADSTPPILLEEEMIRFDSANYNFVDGNLELSWQILAQVEFEEKFNEEVQAYVPYPKFAPVVKALDGKDIVIKGYLIPVDESGSDESILVLSANPYSSCFFCGAAGPESVIDVILKEKIKGIKTDRVATFSGRLKLNDSDLYYLNYILEDAKLVEM